MQLSETQQKAADAVNIWLKAREKPVFYLAGFAGTGKTSVAKHLAASAGRVRFAAYTGKAASVMRRKGCPASTIHQLVYKPIEEDPRIETLRDRLRANPEDKEASKLLDELLKPKFGLNGKGLRADLIVIDECSMVDAKVGNDLLSFRVPLLVLGDPMQLPPVTGGGFFTERTPDILLTEVHRQAAESGVLQLATKVRNGDKLKTGEYPGGSHVLLPDSDVDLLAFDKILCGTNNTRKHLNRTVRKLKGFKSPLYPEAGDTVVCLKNHPQTGVANGELWTVLACAEQGPNHLEVELQNEDEPERRVKAIAVKHFFDGRGDKKPGGSSEFDINPVPGVHLDFGYALTVHKAQGSQWRNVLVVNESKVFRESAQRWLYTGITRAEVSVTIV